MKKMIDCPGFTDTTWSADSSSKYSGSTPSKGGGGGGADDASASGGSTAAAGGAAAGSSLLTEYTFEEGSFRESQFHASSTTI